MNAVTRQGAPGLILATDLDGTFLGGSEAERQALYRSLDRRDDVLLIFVTGRDVAFLRELVRQPGMPRPDLIVGDVGTSVWDAATWEPIEALERDIRAVWDDANARVLELLAGEPGLTLQATPFRHRVSYYYDPNALREETLRKVEDAGFDWLLSAETYFDVLPRGVQKGPTLLRLIESLNLATERVLVAGDTLNDLSLFETGLKGVAVGNSERKLLEAIDGFDWVHRASAEGAAGIAEAIRHFGLHEEGRG
jgi:HAD superfamily hydrolase (TIGR01484 family)